ncbi:MAG: AAA family ATPase [Firmicutes bacterium]|nr:AAA family ATPase [Bacillota bacterium]
MALTLGKKSSSQTPPTRESPPAESANPSEPPTAESKETAEKPPINPFQAEKPKHSFDDIILNAATYDAIQDVLVLYTKRELIFETWGLGERYKQQNKAGINLYGESGTGKTMVAHAVAKQLDREIITVDISQIESKYVGETSKNLVAMFEYAKESKAIIFFDEADSLLSRRVTNMSHSTDVSVNQTRSVLLMLINDFDDMILFATNFIENYDPAFMRRILAGIKFDLPDEENRAKLWQMYIPPKLPHNADIEKLAKIEGISGSDISTAVLNATLKAARLDDLAVKHEYFEDAVENISKNKKANSNSGTLISSKEISREQAEKELGRSLP